MTRRLGRRGARLSLGIICGEIAFTTLALGVVIAFGTPNARVAQAEVDPAAAAVMAPPPAPEPLPLDGVVVHGAAKGWYVGRTSPPRMGDPVPVVITAYCLSGTTRRGRYVRPGIVAADPKLFPLSRYIELYAGGRYIGRFLVDDTGRNIRKARIDIWMATCREAIIFGRQRGTAVLVPRPEPPVALAGQPAR